MHPRHSTHSPEQQPSERLIVKPSARIPQTCQLRKPQTPTASEGIPRSSSESIPYSLPATTKHTKNVWVSRIQTQNYFQLPQMAFLVVT